MTRATTGKTGHKKREKILSYTKGYRWGRKSKHRYAKEALLHARTFAYRDRKKRKQDFRHLWQIKINAACREGGTTYGRFMHALKQKNVVLDRKILAELAEKHPEIFKQIVEKVR